MLVATQVRIGWDGCAVAKINRRLGNPSSHTRLLARVPVLDVAWGAISPIAAFLLRDGTINSPDGVAIYCGVALVVSLLVFQWFRTSTPIARFYSIRDALDLLMACVVIAALSAVSAFVITRLLEAPRSIPILHFLLLASGLLGMRMLLRLRDTRRESYKSGIGRKVEHVIIVGASRLAWFFSKMIEELAPGEYQIVAILDERRKLLHRSLNGYPIIGTSADLEKVIDDYSMHGVHIDKVVVAAHPDDLSDAALKEVDRVCRELTVALEILPERLMSAPASSTTGLSTPELEETPESLNADLRLLLDRPFWKIKRATDFTLALTAIVLFSPLIFAVFSLVMLDVGVPVIFWQRRVGRNGMPLHLYKFRTLKTLYDRQTRERREVHDPSRIGRFLRATRLDEVPQLWNVLTGEMSLVGPRPLLPIDQPDDSTLRLAVRPGLTGWAQISGGKLISIKEKNALDEWYVRHASYGLDMIILFRTALMLLGGDRRNEKWILAAVQESSCARSTPSISAATKTKTA